MVWEDATVASLEVTNVARRVELHGEGIRPSSRLKRRGATETGDDPVVMTKLRPDNLYPSGEEDPMLVYSILMFFTFAVQAQACR